MPTAQRLRKARVKVIDTKMELIRLRNFLLTGESCLAEARAVSEMKRQLEKIAARLEGMAKHFNMYKRA